jgi:hypothetical protein
VAKFLGPEVAQFHGPDPAKIEALKRNALNLKNMKIIDANESDLEEIKIEVEKSASYNPDKNQIINYNGLKTS